MLLFQVRYSIKRSWPNSSRAASIDVSKGIVVVVEGLFGVFAGEINSVPEADNFFLASLDRHSFTFLQLLSFTFCFIENFHTLSRL